MIGDRDWAMGSSVDGWMIVHRATRSEDQTAEVLMLCQVNVAVLA